MGRIAKSEHQRFVHGTERPLKPATESHVVGGRPKFPRDLDPTLKKVFKHMCARLAERRALTPGDVELIRLYCFQFDRHKRNAALLRSEGEIVTYFRLDSNGQSVPQVKANLRLKIVTDAERQMLSVLVTLGLTPTAKDRVKPVAPDVPKEDEIIVGTIAWYEAQAAMKAREPAVVILPPTVIDEDPPPEPEPEEPTNA